MCQFAELNVIVRVMTSKRGSKATFASVIASSVSGESTTEITTVCPAATSFASETSTSSSTPV
jgi:hypothetical protein